MLVDSHRPCRRWLVRCALAMMACCSHLSAAHGQGSNGLPGPSLSSVAPNGGQRGSTLELRFDGRDVAYPTRLLFNHAGFEVEPIFGGPDPKKAPPPPFYGEEEARLEKVDPKAPPPPGVSAFRIHIAPDLPLGIYEVRLVNSFGISNPVPFVVSDLQVIEEKENNDDVATSQRVPLNCILSGAIGSKVDVDYFVFNGNKGQRVLAEARTASIDSKLLAQLEIYNAAGKLLGSCRPLREHDSLLDITLPASGDYYLRICEFAHMEGNPNSRYHVALGTFPYIDSVTPLAVEPGKKARVTVIGRNLPGGILDPTIREGGAVLERTEMTIDGPGAGEQSAAAPSLAPASNAATFLPRFEFRVRNSVGTSNGYPMLIARAPVFAEHEPNDSAETAQQIMAPGEVTGRLDNKKDHDWYAFKARKGETYLIDLWSERLGAATDLRMAIRDVANKRTLADLEDDPVNLDPLRFPTASADPPAYKFVAPADGTFHVEIHGTAAHNSSPAHRFYHLRILREQPNFHLLALPSSDASPGANVLHRGGCVRWLVLVEREAGWNGPVELQMTGLPAGVLAHKQTIAAGVNHGSYVVSCTLDADAWSGPVRLLGRGEIDGKMVEREATPVGIILPSVNKQQNDPALSRAEKNLVLAVRGRAPYTINSHMPRTIVAGSKIDLPLEVTRLAGDFKAPVQIGPAEGPGGMPPGIVFNDQKPLAVAPDKESAPATIEVKKTVLPGEYTLYLEGTAPYAVSNDLTGKAAKINVTTVFPASPITFTVLPAPAAKPVPAKK
jgi:hypothetical protein